MPNINLLPWREELRNEHEKEFYTLLGLVVLAGLMVWGLVHLYYVRKIEYQESRNMLIEQRIKIVEEQIKEIKDLETKKERLLAQINAIQSLQGDRPLIVRLFDEIVTSLPDGLSLENIQQNGRQLSIQGVAESNARVSSLMRNIEKSQWVESPRLSVIERKSNDKISKLSEFNLSFSQKASSATPLEEEEE